VCSSDLAGAAKRNAAADTAALKAASIADKNKREAAFRANGQMFYTDANGDLRPVFDDKGNPVFIPAALGFQKDEKVDGY
jgi:hypothetical protein